MRGEQFEELFEDVVGRSREVLVVKAKEYASGGDRLHNFKKSAAGEGITPEQALWGFNLKHWVSLSDMVASGEEYSEAQWDEKLGDMLNYLILLKAITVDRANGAIDSFISGETATVNFTQNHITIQTPGESQ